MTLPFHASTHLNHAKAEEGYAHCEKEVTRYAHRSMREVLDENMYSSTMPLGPTAEHV